MYRSFGDDDDIFLPPQIHSLTPSIHISKSRSRPWFLPRDNDVIEVLETARSLISHHRWCKGQMATTEYDFAVDPLDHRAMHYCIVGAIRQANRSHSTPRFFSRFWRDRRYEEAIDIVFRAIDTKKHVWALNGSSAHREIAVMNWNDASNYGDVLAGINRAISVAPYRELV